MTFKHPKDFETSLFLGIMLKNLQDVLKRNCKVLFNIKIKFDSSFFFFLNFAGNKLVIH